MSLNEYLKCPGLELTLSVRPEEYVCPRCGQVVEIWTDEVKRKCADCGFLVLNPNPMVTQMNNFSTNGRKSERPIELIELTNLAIMMGATEASIIPSSKIRIETDLAELCYGNPPCENLGKAPSCPPYVEGPERFMTWRDKSPYTIVLRIDVPSEVMFSAERREVMQLLQENLATIEHAAINLGYSQSKAFAGGSCKRVWCYNHANCPVLEENGPCRYPDKARPSMSGYGVNVTKLMESAGWPNKKAGLEVEAESDTLIWIAGMILLMRR